MIADEPTWRFTARYELTQWYGHVHIADGSAIGQWFCVDLESGRRLWEHGFDGPNTICGISEGVIVATETKSGGAWTASFGASGISVETGKILWPIQRDVGFWRGLLELFPGVGPPVPGGAVLVEGSHCFCEGGKIVNIHDGSIVGDDEDDVEERRENAQEKDPARKLYMGRPVTLEKGEVLSRESGELEGFHLFRIAPNRERLWHFDLGREHHYILGNFYSYRYRDGFVYMVVSDRYRELTFDPSKPHGGRYSLWTLDVKTGNVCQKVPIPDWAGECRIEDVDDHHLLISTANQTLFCYGRRVTASRG